MRTLEQASTVVLLLASLVAGGCDSLDRGGTYGIPEVREHDVDRPGSRAVVDDARRLGVASGALPAGHPPMEGGGAPGPAAGASPLRWDLPDGWEAVPGSSMRLGNFVVPGRDDLECYISVLPGRSGGLVANVNRWRNQLGLEPLDDAAIDALPRRLLLGEEATLVAAEGVFTGMGGPERAGWALRGLIVASPAGTVFVKMTGPAAAVTAEADAFDALCASLEAPPPGGHSPDDGHDHGAAAPPPSAPLTWTAPEGWTRGEDRPMRVVTFLPGGDGEVECYITILGGDGGGVAANVNRWRNQAGQAPLSDAEVDSLPSVAVLGRKSPIVEASGSFQGMAGPEQEGFALLGVPCVLDGESVFIKMTGPAKRVHAERGRFIELCRSLQR